jgi:hypothetical protein
MESMNIDEHVLSFVELDVGVTFFQENSKN